MAGQRLSIPVEGGAFSGYLCLPASGTGPGLVMAQEIFGINAALRAMAELYAEEGYVVLVPDLFWRMEPGVDLDYDDAGRARAMDFYARFDVDQGVRDLGAAVDALRSLPACTGKVGVIGFCLGGLLAYLAATRLKVDAAVGFYGVGIERHLDEAAHLACPLLLHFGGKDALAPPEAVAQIRQALSSKLDATVAVYPEAGHAFYFPSRTHHHRPSALLAHSPTIGLFRRTMGPNYDLAAIWERHCELEFERRDADTTMTTMTADPYVNHVPTMTGGVGQKELHRFYAHHFIPRLPPDTRIVPVSRVVGADRVVDELLFCFTHDTELDFLLPGVPPTGKYVEVPTVAVVRFRGDKLLNEHIYWDQASVLVQVGLLDPQGLPVCGIEQARKLLDESLPSNTLMKRWAESAGK